MRRDNYGKNITRERQKGYFGAVSMCTVDGVRNGVLGTRFATSNLSGCKHICNAKKPHKENCPQIKVKERREEIQLSC